MKRPDLLQLKNAENAMKQPGIARSMAAILAKQEGWGTPLVCTYHIFAILYSMQMGVVGDVMHTGDLQK